MTQVANAVPVLAGLSEIASRYDVVLSDVWGVVHNGVAAHPGASDALTRFRAQGGAVVLISNAPRPNDAVRAQLDRLGVPHSAYDAVVTSGDVTRHLLAAHADAHVHHLGPERDSGLFAGLALSMVGEAEADIVCCSGLDDDRSETPEHYRARFEALVARGVPLICANPDLVVELGDRLLYCAGALAELYASMGGAVTYAGKPHAPIYREALQAAGDLLGRPVELARVLAVGDALRTDLAGAQAMGIDALFVAAGIHAGEVMREGRLDPVRLGSLLAADEARAVAAMERLSW